MLTKRSAQPIVAAAITLRDAARIARQAAPLAAALRNATPDRLTVLSVPIPGDPSPVYSCPVRTAARAIVTTFREWPLTFARHATQWPVSETVAAVATRAAA